MLGWSSASENGLKSVATVKASNRSSLSDHLCLISVWTNCASSESVYFYLSDCNDFLRNGEEREGAGSKFCKYLCNTALERLCNLYQYSGV